MTNKYNFVSITPVFKIRSFLLFLIFALLGSSSIIYAANPIQVVQKATGVSKAAAEINPGADPFVTLSSTSIGLFATAGSQEKVDVTSNTTWEVNSDQLWLTVSQVSGSGNGTLTFTADVNNSGAERTAIVTVKSIGLDDQIIVVTQMPDIPSITFTSSVSTKSLSVQLQFKSTGTVYIDWGDGIRTSYPASTLGGTYTTPLDLSGTPVKIYGMGITNISLSSNYLTTLVITQCTDLSYLDISRNSLGEMDLSKNTRLSYLDASSNNLKGLDVSYNTGLTTLSCFSNKIISLDVSKNIALSKLYCYLNLLTSLDVNSNPLLKTLYCYSNNLDFRTLPQSKAGYQTYKYSPQTKLHVVATNNLIDLSSQLSVKDINNALQNTIYKWYTRTGVLLVPGTDYTEASGVFTFLKTYPDSVYCDMTNKAFPKFVDSEVLRTENIKMILEKPTVTTLSVSNINPTTATGSGSIDKAGVPNPTANGVCLNLNGMPTISDKVAPGSNQNLTLGNFTADITGLNPYTTYHIRAFATNLAGTGYGADSTFTTKGLPPIITTNPATNIGITTATFNGCIESLGAPNPVQHGFIWDTTDNPILGVSPSKNLGLVSQIGTFPFNVTGLIANTIYYYRAYAINNVDTVYGEKLSIKTSVPTITIIPDPTVLTGFTSMFGLPSASQIFSIGGILTDDLIITAPDGFQVRENGIGSFGKTVPIKSVSEILTVKQIEVRISPSTPLGAVSGNVVCSSTGATPQFVSVDGIVSPAKLTVSELVITSTKEYDGNADAKVIKVTLSGVAFIDEGNVVLSATASYDDKSVGNGKKITVKYTISGSAVNKYIVPVDSVITGDITKKQLTTMDGINPIKEYDGTRMAVVPSGPLMGVVDAEIADVQLGATALYNDSTIGSGKTITVTYSLSGLKADNYLAPANYIIPNGEITRKQLFVSLSNPTVPNKEKDYDGTAVATFTLGILDGVLAIDDGKVILEATASYDNANSGSDKKITVTYTLTGSEAYKYLPPVDEIFTDGKIKGKPLVISVPNVTFKKDYDGNDTAAVDFGVIISGVDPGDDVVLSADAKYDDANAGTGKTITLIYKLTNAVGGTPASTYSVPPKVVYNNGEIDRISLTASPTVNPIKVYTSTTRANGTLKKEDIVGLIGADTLTVVLVLQASYDNKNVGTGKIITVDYDLYGENSGNYIKPPVYTIPDGEIKRKPLTVTAVSDTIIYNGTITSSKHPIVQQPEPMDIGSQEVTQVYDDYKVGVAHVMTASGLVIKNGAGVDVSTNYDIMYNHSVLPGIIKAKPLIVSDPTITLQRAYNGNTVADVTPGVLSGLEPIDLANVGIVSIATYDDATIGTSKKITVTYTLNGSAAGNYSPPLPFIVTTGVITQAPLVVTAVTETKMYDGKISSSGTPATTGTFAPGDIQLIAPTQVFDNANAGSTHVMIASGLTIQNGLGLDVTQNYAITYSPSVDPGVITQVPLSVTAVTETKMYDGKISSSGTPATTGTFAPGDIQLTAPSQVFDNANAGSMHVMTASGLAIQNGLGLDVTLNYNITYNPSVLPGVITQAPLSVTAVSDIKTYTGTIISTAKPEVGTLVSGDVVSVEAVQVYDDPNVGIAHVMTASGITIQNGAGDNVTTNYDITYNPSAQPGVITLAPLSVTAVSDTRAYNGTTSSIGEPVVGALGVGDVINASPIQVYDNAYVGSTHIMTASGLTIKNGAGDNVTTNYDITYNPSVEPGVITQAPLIVTAVTETKMYDGKISSSGTPATTGTFAPGDIQLTAPTQVFDNANAGSAHVMIASGLTIQNGLGLDVTLNYAITYSPSVDPGVITQVPLSVTAVTETKMYDGKISSSGTPATTGTFASGDIQLTAPSQVFDNANAGSMHVMTASGLAIQNGLGLDVTLNYNITYNPSVLPGVISQAPLSVTAVSDTKTYTGTIISTAKPEVGTLVSGDVVSVYPIQVYDDPNVGSAHVMTASGIAIQDENNDDATGNYTISYISSPSTGIIEPKPLTCSDPIIKAEKVYNGNLVADVIVGTLSGVEAVDMANVVLKATALYNDMTVGTGKTITVSYTLTGSAASNYTAPSDYIILTGEISGMPLTITPPTVTLLKVYNGTPLANVIAGSLSGIQTGDDVTVIAAATYDNATVGTGKTITVTYTLGGANAAIYTVPSNDVITNGQIDPKTLTVSNTVVIDNKVYDGNSTAGVTPGTLNGVETGDDVTLNATATYDNAIEGTGKTISVVYTLTGASAGNYSAPSNYLLSNGVITVKQLIPLNMTVTLIKTYDGSNSVTVIPGVLTGVESGDDVTLNVVASYDNANAGIGKTITVTFSLSGKAAGNYIAPANYSINSGVINPKTLSASKPLIATIKEYDGNTSVAFAQGILVGVDPSDVPNVTLTATASYDYSTAGIGKTITITYGLIGSQAGNYVAPPDYVVTTGIITPKPLVVVSLKITNSKPYDGTTPATFTVGDLTGVMPTDAGNVILSGEAIYDNANAGSGKNITVTFSLSGIAAGNYKTPSSYTITNGVILARQLTISDPVVILNKMVDGNTSAVITTPGTMQGVEATDAGKISITVAANYDNQNVGINKKITVVYTLGGSAMGNYIAPVDFIVTGAKISDNVILSPIVTPTNGCEGSSLDLAYDVLTGTPTQYRITFDATTLAAGIQNVSYTNLPSASASGILPINIPAGTKDGNYLGTLQFRNELGIESPVYTFLFTINVSKDYIISKFDDVVLIDNSSNRFVAYQWYKDGVELKGATKQFYNDLGGLVGSYTVKLTTVDGQTLYTCPKVLETSLAKKVSVFPSPVKKYQLSTIKLTGVGDDELVGAELSVYTMQGTRVYHSTQVEKVNSISLPPIAGMYVGRVTTSKGQELQFKVIVIE